MVVEDRDLGYKAIVKEVKKLKGSSTEVGLWGSGGGPDVNLAARATVHEFGSRKVNIPSRPFNRKCFDDNLKTLQKIINGKYNLLLERRIDTQRLLEQIGEWYTGKLKDTITKGGFAPLKLATIRRKKSSKPLIDNADMRNRIEHREKIK